jgi:hypothetical protein
MNDVEGLAFRDCKHGAPPWALTAKSVARQLVPSIASELEKISFGDCDLKAFEFPGAIHPFWLPSVFQDDLVDVEPPFDRKLTQWGRQLVWDISDSMILPARSFALFVHVGGKTDIRISQL